LDGGEGDLLLYLLVLESPQIVDLLLNLLNDLVLIDWLGSPLDLSSSFRLSAPDLVSPPTALNDELVVEAEDVLDDVLPYRLFSLNLLEANAIEPSCEVVERLGDLAELQDLVVLLLALLLPGLLVGELFGVVAILLIFVGVKRVAVGAAEEVDMHILRELTHHFGLDYGK